MRSFRYILLAVVAMLCCLGTGAQELNCTFDVDSKNAVLKAEFTKKVEEIKPHIVV